MGTHNDHHNGQLDNVHMDGLALFWTSLGEALQYHHHAGLDTYF